MKAFPRDIDVQTLKLRHIGIESELGVGEFNRDNLTLTAREHMRKIGLLHSAGNDGGGREFRTCPISIRSLYQVRGQKRLREYFEVLNKETKVLTSGGTHIHISILDTDHKNMEMNAIALSTAFYSQFQKICGRQSSWARMNEVSTLEDVENFIRGCRYDNGSRRYLRYHHMLTPTGRQTLEFRGPKGSNSGEEVLAWAEFLRNVVKVANHKSVDGVTFGDLLKGERIEAYAKTLKGWRKLTKTDMNKKLNVNALA